MEFKDYYKIMGLDRNVSQEEIKRAYRKLARKYHPDVSKEADAENKFKELGEAYEVLKDPEKRAKYDKFGQYWQQQGNRAHQQENQQHYQNGEEINPADFEDFISSIFGGRYQQQQQQHYYDQGQDIHARLDISLEDSYHGAEKVLQLQVPHFGPHHQVEYQQRSVRVKIPKGIGDMQQIRLKGQGGQRSGGKAGDLYIEIHILPHSMFRLDKKDIHLKLPITPWEAVLGATIGVPTLGGTVNLKIPPLAQSGKQLRLKGRGLSGHPAGDQYVSLEIVIPEQENMEANKLYEQLAKLYVFNPREKLGVRHG